MSATISAPHYSMRATDIAMHERTVAANAAGFVVHVYRINRDAFDWVYGSLSIPHTEELERYFALVDNESQIEWPRFKQWLLTRPVGPHIPKETL